MTQKLGTAKAHVTRIVAEARAPFVGLFLAAALATLGVSSARSGADERSASPSGANAAPFANPAPEPSVNPASPEPAPAEPVVSFVIDPMLIPEPAPAADAARATTSASGAQGARPNANANSTMSVLERPIAPPEE